MTLKDTSEYCIKELFMKLYILQLKNLYVQMHIKKFFQIYYRNRKCFPKE